MSQAFPFGRVCFAVALGALGITGLVNGDFALVWQNVPLAAGPVRTALAGACAVLELAVGVGLLIPGGTRMASRMAFALLAAWLLGLEIPAILHAPQDASAWGGWGEVGAMLAGAWCLWALHAGARERRRLPFAVQGAGLRAARWLLVLALPALGVEVIVAAVQADSAVMQPWLRGLPWPAGWAMLTGIGSIATSLALLLGIWPRLAATLEAAMVALIGLAYWGPALTTGRTATTAFIVTMLVSAGVGLIAASYRGLAWRAVGAPVWKLPARGCG